MESKRHFLNSEQYGTQNSHSGRETQSPFKLPTDEEVFIAREAERLQRQELKERSKDMKIWQKQTSCTKSQLKRSKQADYTMKPSEELPISHHFPPKQRNLITAALEIVNTRKKQPQKAIKTENIRDFVEQKKEMFLVEMHYRILKNEKEKIKQRISNKEHALKRSEEMLDQDTKRFNEHMEKNRIMKDEAISRANGEAFSKKEKEAEIKQIEQKKAAISAEINRNEEYLEILKKHKHFLERLTPTDWLEQRKKEHQKKYDSMKQEWMNRQKIEDTNESYYLDETDSQISAGTSNSAARKRQNALKKSSIMDMKFEDLIKKGIIELNAGEEEMMYFDNPSQLMAILKELEDNNLFLIEHMQEMEHQLEIMKGEFEVLQHKDGGKAEDLKKNKEHLKSTLHSMDGKIGTMERRIHHIENKTETSKGSNLLKDEISRFYKDLQFDDDAALGPLDMLTTVENEINEILKKLKIIANHDGKLIEDLSKEKETVRREKMRNDFLKLQQDKNIERIKVAQKRAEGPGFQKFGRPQMTKVRFSKDKKKQVFKVVEKTEAELIQEFIDETIS